MAGDRPVERGVLGTPWRREFATPVRAFLRTESGSAGILVAAIALGLVWANLGDSYEQVWTTPFGFRLGDSSLTRELRTWVNSGLMTFFFLVVGLEARREIDLGDLRDRSRFLLPVAAGLFGMVVPVGLYLALNAGGDGAGGWGVAMSTDTALALGLLVMVGRDVPDRVRAFLLTVFVVDDIVALLVIAIVYTEAGPRRVPRPRARAVRRDAGGQTPAAARPGPRLRGRGGDLVQHARERRRPRRHRPRDRPDRPGVHPGPGGPRGGERPVPAVPRGADAGPRPHRGGRPDPDAVAQRPAPALLPPVDQLRDRAALRARERGRGHRRVVPRPRRDLTDHARHRRGVRRRQAGRSGLGVLGDRSAHARSAPAGGRLGLGHRQRDDRRHRVHRVVPDRRARLRR